MTATDTRHRVGVYGWSPGSGGVHHHRIGEPLRVLAAAGNTAFTGRVLDDATLERVDTVLAHTLHTPDPSEAWQRLARLDSHRLVLDVDDAMWHADYGPFAANYTAEALELLYRNVSVAHVVTTPSSVIAQHLQRWNANVWVVPNTVPAWLLDHTMPPRDRPTIGYQGSPSHARDWTTPQQVGLARFLSRNSDWGIHLYGSAPGGFGLRDGVLHTPWAGTVDAYYQSVSFDVGIGPLRRTRFNAAKSALRAVEYAALGIVAVLPSTPDIYTGWVEDGVTGRLIGPHETLRGVLTDVARATPHRLTMATTARLRAAQWTTEANAHRWVTAWASQ